MFTSHSGNLRGETEVLVRFEMEWDANKAVERVIGRMMGDENMHFQMAINESDPHSFQNTLALYKDVLIRAQSLFISWALLLKEFVAIPKTSL